MVVPATHVLQQTRIDHGAAPPCLLSAWKALVLPESQGGFSHATSGCLLTPGLHAGRGVVLPHLLRDLQGPRGAEVQPQLLPVLPAAVLEQEESAARVSRVQEEVFPDGTHGEPGAKECGRHLPKGPGEKDGCSRSSGWSSSLWGATGVGGCDVWHTQGSPQTLLSG